MTKEKTKGKIQFVFVNLEAEEDTLAEAVRQMGAVLNHGMNPQPRVLVAVPQTKALGNGDGGGHDATADVIYEVQPEVQSDPNESNDNGHQSTGSSVPKKPKKVPKTPAILKDFDPNDADVPLSEFMKGKDITTNVNKYIHIATWFKRYKNVDEIDTSHIYTCFQLMKWASPDDVGKAFRNMKDTNKYFDNGSQKGMWEITIIGLNEVDRLSGMGAGGGTEE